jgi:hypothetical protein
MWTTEDSVETSAGPEQIWRLWADVARWPEWNGDIERIELNGEFAAGSRILMTPIRGGDDRALDRGRCRARVLRRRGAPGRDRRPHDPSRRAHRPRALAGHLSHGDHRRRRGEPRPANRSRDQRRLSRDARRAGRARRVARRVRRGAVLCDHPWSSERAVGRSLSVSTPPSRRSAKACEIRFCQSGDLSSANACRAWSASSA